jgi:hypothetical protein
MLEHLPSKHDALNLTPASKKKEERKKKKEKSESLQVEAWKPSAELASNTTPQSCLYLCCPYHFLDLSKSQIPL